MLELRPGCERCDADLAPDAEGAWICSFECTGCDALRARTARRALPELRRHVGAASDV